MLHQKVLLNDDSIFKLEIIDLKNIGFSGKELLKENQMATKRGKQIVVIAPLSFSPEKPFGLLITFKTPDESRVETDKVNTVGELAEIFKNEFGLKVLYDSNEI